MKTRLSVAIWLTDVRGYFEAMPTAKRRICRTRLRAVVRDDIANAERLLALWRSSKTTFMAVSTVAETTFIHDRSFGRHLQKKIRLMRKYGDAEPRIDGEIIRRVREKC